MAANRRVFLERAVALGIAATVADAARPAPRPARAAAPVLPDATLQAFADTILPGRKAERTDLGAEIHPQAIAGVDAQPGAVEADALALYHHPLIGFDAIQGPFLADLEARALAQGGPFLTLDFDRRTAAVISGLSFDNPDRILWEAATAVPFTAFCAAALVPEQTARRASGYRVMGYPGRAPRGYRRAGYGRRLARERTRGGNLG
jgi:hypothetical protein